MRKKKCKNPACRKLFEPERTFQDWCSIDCAIEIVRIKREKKRKAEQKRRKEGLKTRSEWIKDAQKAFNRYIRFRDAGLPCISCGRTEQEVENAESWKPGGAWDCGHYLSVGSHPELRFEELNAHRQCKSCNGGAGNYTKKRYTVSRQYRETLIARIGLENVEWLEGPHDPKNYTINDMKHIISTYKLKIKELNNDN